MVKLIGLLSRFKPAKVLVIGDFMLDTYTTGKVRRISPEAPVSVLHVQKEESLPGGAGNVALNLTSLGASVVVVGRVGADRAGQQLKEVLSAEGIDVRGLFVQEGIRTPLKNRLIADAQQVLRVDFETLTLIPPDLELAVIDELPLLMQGVQIVAVSDYAKGFLSKKILQSVIALAKTYKIPVIVDPKGDDFSKYEGADIIKPNSAEAYAAAKLPPESSLDDVASRIFLQTNIRQLMVTRSEAGISLFEWQGKRSDFSVRSREVKDVTGAGDTVLAMMSVTLSNGLDLTEAVQLSNIAAGIAIERLGCARVTLAELSVRLFQLDAENKVFDEEHLFALQQVLKNQQYSVLGVESRQGMTNALFRAIRMITLQDPARRLIVYVRDHEPDEEFISLISSLADVDFIVLKCESLRNLCEEICPHEVYLMQSNQLTQLEHPHVLLNHT